MKRSLAAGFAVAVIAAVTFPVAANATGHDTPCLMPVGWYANADEQTRLPTPTRGGLQFAGNDLIHHATATDVEHLSPGSFTAHPAPDQTSFFSVEVFGSDGGYATLRWNATSSKWDMVTGGALYSNASPAALVDMVTPHKSHKVVSFGVGYTANPPGTITTVVSSVSFQRKTYRLGCFPPKPSHSSSHSPSHSASASASASASTSASASASSSASTSTSASASTTTSASPSTSASTSPSTTAAGVVTTTSPVRSDSALPVTGANGWALGAAAGFLLLAGAGVFVLARRRRMRFTV